MKEHGFTLIEILIAISIIGIIMGSVFTLFDLAYSSWLRADNKGEWEQQWRALEAFFHRDTSNLFFSKFYQGYYYKGNFHELEIIISDNGELRKVHYYFDSYNNQLVREIFTKTNHEMNKKQIFFPDHNIQNLEFSFYDRDKGYWKSNWSYLSEKKLPGAIRLLITIKDIQLPPLIEEIHIGKEYVR